MGLRVTAKALRIRRSITVLLVAFLVLLMQAFGLQAPTDTQTLPDTPDVLSDTTQQSERAAEVLEKLPVKGRASKSGYKRAEFGDGWAQVGDCDMRNIMLSRYLSSIELGSDSCVVLSGTLQDSYSGKTIAFIRGATTSDDVQIDHVVALSDAWQKGAQQLVFERRVQFANDPLNLLPVDGDANQQKGDSDAASWLPPNRSFRCQYVARQVAVKYKYGLWVTAAEKAAIKRILNGCGDQVLPVESTSSS